MKNICFDCAHCFTRKFFPLVDKEYDADVITEDGGECYITICTAIGIVTTNEYTSKCSHFARAEDAKAGIFRWPNI